MVCSIGLTCPIIKITSRGRRGRGPVPRELRKQFGFRFITFTKAEAIDLKCGLQRSLTEAHRKKKYTQKRAWPWTGGATKTLGSPLLFLRRLKLSASQFSAQLGFAMAHHKNTPKRKIWRCPWAKDLTKFWEFPFIISAMDEVNDCEFGMHLGFKDTAYYKITPA